MKKELIKLASDLDRMGYQKLANKVDSLLLKTSQLYDSGSWNLRSQFDLVLPSSITEHYYDIAKRKGTLSDLESYLRDNKVQDWQKEKVTSAVMSDPRWTEKDLNISEATRSTDGDRPVTKGELEKLVMHSMDSGNTYKMSDDMYEKIKNFVFGEGNLPKDAKSDNVKLSDLNDVERAAIMSTRVASLRKNFIKKF